MQRRKGENTHAPKGERPIASRRLTRGEREALRVAAQSFYIFDLQNVDAQRMAKMPQFSGLGAATISRWITQGHWAAERARVRRDWSEALKRKLSDQLVQTQYDATQKLKMLHEQAFSYAMGGEDGMLPAPPKTFVEAAKLFVALDGALTARRNEMRDSFGLAADDVAQRPQSGSSQTSIAQPHPQMALPEMSADEYQELAHSLMARNFSHADGVSAERLAEAREDDVDAVSSHDAGGVGNDASGAKPSP